MRDPTDCRFISSSSASTSYSTSDRSRDHEATSECCAKREGLGAARWMPVNNLDGSSIKNHFTALFIFLLLVYNGVAASDGCLLENDRNSVYVSVFEDAPIGRIFFVVEKSVFGVKNDF